MARRIPRFKTLYDKSLFAYQQAMSNAQSDEERNQIAGLFGNVSSSSEPTPDSGYGWGATPSGADMRTDQYLQKAASRGLLDGYNDRRSVEARKKWGPQRRTPITINSIRMNKWYDEKGRLR